MKLGEALFFGLGFCLGIIACKIILHLIGSPMTIFS